MVVAIMYLVFDRRNITLLPPVYSVRKIREIKFLGIEEFCVVGLHRTEAVQVHLVLFGALKETKLIVHYEELLLVTAISTLGLNLSSCQLTETCIV